MSASLGKNPSSEVVPRHERPVGRGRFRRRRTALFSLTARAQGWRLLSSPYCVDEAVRNLCKLGPKATHYWRSSLSLRLELVSIELVFDQVLVFPKAKDRPVLLSALGAQADLLLTLDEHDFQRVIGSRVYGLRVRSPGQFLMEQRAVGRI